MRRSLIVTRAMAFLVAAVAATTVRAQDHQHGDDHDALPHRHMDAAALPNPVPADAHSLAEGKGLFGTHCVACHGVSGAGDGVRAAKLNPGPADLTDGAWKHGSSDGELYTLIRDGARRTAMQGYGGLLNTRELWSIVNYLRSLDPTPTPSR